MIIIRYIKHTLKHINKFVNKKWPFKRRYDKHMNKNDIIIVHNIPNKQRINIGNIHVSCNESNGMDKVWLSKPFSWESDG
jgi:hypothetical protein